MPSITKAEYQRLKDRISLLELLLSDEKLLGAGMLRALRDQQYETEKWKRYYAAVREAFKVEEEVEIPNCFSLRDSVEYIVNRQEQIEAQRKINEKLDNYAREVSGRFLRGFHS